MSAGTTVPEYIGEPRKSPSLKNTRNGVVPEAPPSNDFHFALVQRIPPAAGTASNSTKFGYTFGLSPGSTAMKVVTHLPPVITGS